MSNILKNTQAIDLSEQSKKILLNVFSDDNVKKNLIDTTLLFVLDIFHENKIVKYTDEIKNIITVEKGNGSENIDVVDILDPIKNILEDICSTLESMKPDLNSYDRTFIICHIDVISLITILLAIDHLQEKNLIDSVSLTKILLFIKNMTYSKIDMQRSKCFKISSCLNFFMCSDSGSKNTK